MYDTDKNLYVGFIYCVTNKISFKGNVISCCQHKSVSAYGYKYSFRGEDLTLEIQKRPVNQFSCNGIFIKKFSSITDAANKTGISNSNISACCNRKNHIAGNFIWRYENDIVINEDIEKLQAYRQRHRKINQFTIKNEYVRTFSSLNDAYKSIEGVKSPYKIKQCCNNKTDSAYGYIWKYADNVNWSDKTKIIDKKEEPT